MSLLLCSTPEATSQLAFSSKTDCIRLESVMRCGLRLSSPYFSSDLDSPRHAEARAISAIIEHKLERNESTTPNAAPGKSGKTNQLARSTRAFTCGNRIGWMGVSGEYAETPRLGCFP